MKKRGILVRKINRLVKTCWQEHSDMQIMASSLPELTKRIVKELSQSDVRKIVLDQVDAHFFEQVDNNPLNVLLESYFLLGSKSEDYLDIKLNPYTYKVTKERY